jgi:hypothetical protein
LLYGLTALKESLADVFIVQLAFAGDVDYVRASGFTIPLLEMKLFLELVP